MKKRSKKSKRIPFNVPNLLGKEETYIRQALDSRFHCGNGEFARRCIELLKKKYSFPEIFLTTSCTTAMEMGVMLADIGPGDEVIVPSYTFSSTANAAVIQGARPIFCEVDPLTMNMDVNHLASLINKKTKMIIPIDYAGIPCEIEKIMKLARKNHLPVMVDGAQSIHSKYKDKPVGTSADLTAFSFHETKNINCGEGGALVVNRPNWVKRAHFLQEKGTDRKLVLDGVKSKYHWVDKGSSFLLSEVLAAMLLAQLEKIDLIVAKRAKVTKAYQKLLSYYEKAGFIQIPHPPDYVTINHHAFFIIFDTQQRRSRFLSLLREKNVHAYIGYVPLHSSPMGRKFGYKPKDLPITEDLASRIVRLPFYTELADEGLEYCVESIDKTLSSLYK